MKKCYQTSHSFKKRSLQKHTPKTLQSTTLQLINKQNPKNQCGKLSSIPYSLSQVKTIKSSQQLALPSTNQQEVLMDQLQSLNELILTGSSPFTQKYISIRKNVIQQWKNRNPFHFKGKGISFTGNETCLYCGLVIKGIGLKWDCGHMTHKQCGQCCPLEDIQ